jgi:hypothetical protein
MSAKFVVEVITVEHWYERVSEMEQGTQVHSNVHWVTGIHSSLLVLRHHGQNMSVGTQ